MEKEKKILLIDDDELFRAMALKRLSRAGYQVVEAANGKEGLLKSVLMAFDLVITDILMPEKDGFETIKELYQRFPKMKIMAISGGSIKMNPEFLLQIAKDFGCQQVLSKPFEKKEFLGAVEELLTEK